MGRRNLKELETTLGYRFRSRTLLDRALTHASMRSTESSKGDNERLEFLGDRVLGLVIAELLCERDPKATEGALARRFNRLVRKEMCAQVGRGLKLGPLLLLSVAEGDSGGRDKDTILADAMEALLAAIFMEGGFPVVRDVVRRLWLPHADGLPDSVADPKSMLQEWAQAQGLPLPLYIEISRVGPDHAPQFTTEVRISGKRPARGIGSNKRAAEQAAATSMLTQEGLIAQGGADA